MFNTSVETLCVCQCQCLQRFLMCVPRYSVYSVSTLVLEVRYSCYYVLLIIITR